MKKNTIFAVTLELKQTELERDMVETVNVLQEDGDQAIAAAKAKMKKDFGGGEWQTKSLTALAYADI